MSPFEWFFYKKVFYLVECIALPWPTLCHAVLGQLSQDLGLLSRPVVDPWRSGQLWAHGAWTWNYLHHQLTGPTLISGCLRKNVYRPLFSPSSPERVSIYIFQRLPHLPWMAVTFTLLASYNSSCCCSIILVWLATVTNLQGFHDNMCISSDSIIHFISRCLY